MRKRLVVAHAFRLCAEAVQLVRAAFDLAAESGKPFQNVRFGVLVEFRGNGAFRRYGLREAGGIFHHGGEYLFHRHIDHAFRLDQHGLAVVFQHDVRAALDFERAQHAVFGKYVYIFLFFEIRQRFVRRFQVQKPAFRRLFGPFFAVIVAVEDDAFMLSDRLCHEVVELVHEIVRAFQSVRKLLQLLRDDGI